MRQRNGRIAASTDFARGPSGIGETGCRNSRSQDREFTTRPVRLESALRLAGIGAERSAKRGGESKGASPRLTNNGRAGIKRRTCDASPARRAPAPKDNIARGGRESGSTLDS